MEKFRNSLLSALERAESLADLMTVEEQAQQLRYDSPAVERLGIPAFNWWGEGLHGVARAGTATLFPQAIGLAATFDTELAHRVADITSTEARVKYYAADAHGDCDKFKGLVLWSPNINIFRDPRWGRGQETFGEDPYLTARMGVEYVKGLQGDGRVLKTAACAKHFAAHSGPEEGRHGFDVKASARDMEETYLPAFRALVKEAHVEGVMGAYNRVNGEAACASRFLMEKLREWNFDGYFVSDCWAISDFHTHHGLTATAPESAALAVKAGCDLNCGNTYLHILNALEEGLLTEEDIRRACVHVLRTRIRLGVLDATDSFRRLPYDIVACDRHKAVALECAEKSVVLLKNNGILPLDEEKIRTIGVIGPNAASREALPGNYCATADRYITLLEGIQDGFSGRVLYAEGCHLYKDRVSRLALPDDRMSETLAVAENSDVVIVCLGLDSTVEGEEGDTSNEFSSGDKKDICLPPSQKKLLDALIAVGKPVVAVVAAGSAINTEASCDALLHVWYPGQSGGKALANILFGRVSPSGKLPVTFYESAEKLPDFTDYSMKNRTYRYVSDNVLYPFGYGLTYSRVICTALRYSERTAYITVTNGGDCDTGDVVQLYIRSYCGCSTPNAVLCGFKRVFLRAGETTELRIELQPAAFETVDECGIRAVRGDRFTLYAGTSAPDELSCSLTGADCVSLDITL